MDETPQDMYPIWVGDRYYMMRGDGTGDVEFDTVPRPTYGNEVTVSLSTDAVLALANKIIAARELIAFNDRRG